MSGRVPKLWEGLAKSSTTAGSMQQLCACSVASSRGETRLKGISCAARTARNGGQSPRSRVQAARPPDRGARGLECGLCGRKLN